MSEPADTPEQSLTAPEPHHDAHGASSESDAVTQRAIDESTHPHWKRNVALFIGGQTVSLLGSSLVQYAVLWYMTLTTKDGLVVALTVVFGFLPQAVISIFGGVWADRHHRKYLIMGADAAIAAATLVLALLMMGGNNSHWLIYLILAVRSAGAGIQGPAVSALVPQLVPASQLLRVNGINGSMQSALMLVAPPLAAVLYASFEMGHILLIDVVTAVIGIGMLALVPVGRIVRDGAEDAGYFDDLKEGMLYIKNHQFVRWLLTLFAVIITLAAAPSFLTPLMIARTFGEEVWKLTANEMAFAIGMTIGGALVAVWGGRFSRMRLIVISLLILSVINVALGLSPTLWIFLTFMFLCGLCIPGFSTPAMTVMQEVVEPERHGRVFGFMGIVGAVAMPLGMAVFGPLANVMSVQMVLILSGVATLLALAIAFLSPAGRRALAANKAVVDPGGVS